MPISAEHGYTAVGEQESVGGVPPVHGTWNVRARRQPMWRFGHSIPGTTTDSKTI
jgi:hypothetical protein